MDNFSRDLHRLTLSKAFTALMDSTGITQVVSKPTHLHSHTLDSVLTRGIKICDFIVHPHNQGRSKLFKSEGDGCDFFINNRNNGYNDRGVRH